MPTTNRETTTTILSKVALLFFVYCMVQLIIAAFLTLPSEGDSLYYHIPLARNFLNGSFINAEYGQKFHLYFPAATESVLAMFLLLHLPLNLFNVIAIMFLFVSGYQLSQKLKLKPANGILLAVSMGLVTTVSRWALAQTVDIWLAVYYVQALNLLLGKMDQGKDWVWLGVWTGLVMGTKYSGLGFAFFLLVSFWKKLRLHFKVWRLAGMLLPMLTLGGFWYVRNLITVQNPVYPLHSFLFPGRSELTFMRILVGETFYVFPRSMFNAFISEYMVWSVMIIILITLLFVRKVRAQLNSDIRTLLLIAGLNALVFIVLPSGDSYQLHVSQFRFSYVVMMPLMAVIFWLAQKCKQESLMAIAATSNLLLLPSFAYYPKLIWLLLPVAIVIFYWDDIVRLKPKLIKALPTLVTNFTLNENESTHTRRRKSHRP